VNPKATVCVASPDKQASMHAPPFGTHSEQYAYMRSAITVVKSMQKITQVAVSNYLAFLRVNVPESTQSCDG